jgi:hypothetical protein
MIPAKLSPVEGFNHIRVEVVTKYDQLLHALAVRAICFMEEHGVPATQNFDGNDYQATHFVAYANDEPIASARLRWFGDFAKMERSCIRKAYRDPRILKHFAQYIYEHVARKGYSKIITHAKPAYAVMWRRALGFAVVEDKAPMSFDGDREPYLELVKHLEPHPRRISSSEDIAVLFRVEGQWDTPSQFEHVSDAKFNSGI